MNYLNGFPEGTLHDRRAWAGGRKNEGAHLSGKQTGDKSRGHTTVGLRAKPRDGDFISLTTGENSVARAECGSDQTSPQYEPPYDGGGKESKTSY